ncbi:MAG: elongation factor P [Bifidobacteriaceae bacterium]|jgi:elongation factor P|nr:elongation factor P [Bifidobacteriaceae bacterium]
MATSNDFKNGMVLKIDGALWSIVEFQHVKPGKGGAFVRSKLKNVLDGRVVEKTYNAGVKVETANVDRRNMQYLYKDADGFVFMDPKSYEQITVPEKSAAGVNYYLLEGEVAQVALNDGVPLYVELPTSVVLEIVWTEPGLQGDRSSAGTKPAKTQTGLEIQVPLFVNQGDKIKINTTSGEYLSRAN